MANCNTWWTAPSRARSIRLPSTCAPPARIDPAASPVVGSTREQHSLGVLQRIGRAVDHHDVAFLEFRIARGLAAQNSLAADARERHFGARLAHFVDRLADAPRPRW